MNVKRKKNPGTEAGAAAAPPETEPRDNREAQGLIQDRFTAKEEKRASAST